MQMNIQNKIDRQTNRQIDRCQIQITRYEQIYVYKQIDPRQTQIQLIKGTRHSLNTDRYIGIPAYISADRDQDETPLVKTSVRIGHFRQRSSVPNPLLLLALALVLGTRPKHIQLASRSTGFASFICSRVWKPRRERRGDLDATDQSSEIFGLGVYIVCVLFLFLRFVDFLVLVI